MKLTKNSMKRKVKSTINPFYGKRGPGAKAGRAAIEAGSGCIAVFFQISWWLIYWLFVGTWLLFKWMFYTFPKFLIQKYRALKPIRKQIVKMIILPILTISFLAVTINYLLAKEFGTFSIALICTIGLCVWIYFTLTKFITLKRVGETVEIDSDYVADINKPID